MARTVVTVLIFGLLGCLSTICANVNLDIISVPAEDQSAKLSLIKDKQVVVDDSDNAGTENSDRNKGPPLDGDNKLKDIRNKGKSPGNQPKATKSRTGRLVNRYHWMITVNDVNATTTMNSDISNGELNVTTVGKDLVSIQGLSSSKFLCMNSQNGRIYVSRFLVQDCIFKEHLEENFHTTFKLNNEASAWFLGITQKGKFLLKVSKKYDFSVLFQLIS